MPERYFRAAVEEGVVAGGGVALVRALTLVDVKGDNEDQNVGIALALRAMEAPIRQDRCQRRCRRFCGG